MRNLSDLRTEVSNHIKTAAISSSRLDEFANEAVNMVARNVDLTHLRDETTFSSSVGVRRYYVQSDILRVLAVFDLTNDRELTRLSDQMLDRADPDRGDSADPNAYSLGPMTEYQDVLAASSTITVVSSSVSDSSSYKVRINGIVSGVEDTELISLDGTSPVVGTKTFSSVTGIRKNSATTGKVTVTATTGGTTLVDMPPAKKVVQFQTIDLFNVPSGVNSYRVKFYRTPRRMVNDQDVPEIPEIYERLVLVGMLAQCREELQDFKRSDELMQQFHGDLRALKANQGAVRNTRRKWGRGNGLEGNRFGSNFPATFILK